MGRVRLRGRLPRADGPWLDCREDNIKERRREVSESEREDDWKVVKGRGGVSG